MSGRICTFVAVLSLLIAETKAIEVFNGEHIKQLTHGTNATVAMRLATTITEEEGPELGRIRIVPGTATVTPQPTRVVVNGQSVEGNLLLASGYFRKGLEGGTVLDREDQQIQTQGGIGIDTGIVLSAGRVSNTDGFGETGVDADRTNGIEGPNDADLSETIGFPYDTAGKDWFDFDPDSGDVDLKREYD